MENSSIDLVTAVEARASFTVEAGQLASAAKFLRMRVALKLTGRNEGDAGAIAAASVRITAQPCGTITLEASNNGYLGALVTLQGEVASPGAFVTSADILEAAAQKAKASQKGSRYPMPVRIKDDGSRAILTCSRVRFQMPHRAADTLPAHPTAGVNATLSAEFSLPLAQFAADLKVLQPAVGTEERRTNLHAVALQRREMAGRERLVLIATDGCQAVFASRDLPAGAEALPDCCIPSDALPALAELAKLATADCITVRLETGEGCEAFTFTAGGASVSMIAAAETFPDMARAIEGAMGEEGEQAPLFPELLPGAPTAQMEKLAKAAPGAVAWEQRGRLMLGSVEDPGLFLCAMRLEGDGTGKLGEHYRGANGETGEVVGPDGITYPVPFKDNGAGIGFTAAQLRALIGESCFETLEFPGADGKPRHVARWLWDDGASRFLIVRADGRCFDHSHFPRDYVTRAEIEAALAGDVAQPANAAVSVEAEPARCEAAVELVEALSEPETAPVAQSEPDPTAVILARLDALEAALATLPAVSAGNATPSGEITPERAKRTPAHERAVRRAWAERKARCWAETERRQSIVDASTLSRAWWHGRKARKATLLRARRLLTAARKRSAYHAEQIATLQSRADSATTAAQAALSEASAARQGQQSAQAELARVRADMADPAQPERASDIVQLRRERDEARTACAALQQRCERAEQARDTLADAVESMASRMALAEAAVRRMQAA